VVTSPFQANSPFPHPVSVLLWLHVTLVCLSLTTIVGSFNLQMEPMMTEMSALGTLCSILVPRPQSSPHSYPLLLRSACQRLTTNVLPQQARCGFTTPAMWTFRFFVWRLMVSAGLVKWYGSDMWHSGHAMRVHYYTQPLPNPVR
jgi:hypothetical protein